MNSQPTILITNDDGVTAPGIRALVEVAMHYGKVVVVAPDSPQSGMGHAVSIAKPLRLTPVHVFDDIGVEAWQCSGTPVDCVKMANDIVMDGAPDYCLSGINHGSNAAINVIYSGTMSAAMEAAIEGIPSAGFSNLNFNHDADMCTAKLVVKDILDKMVGSHLPAHFLLNVNIPDIHPEAYKGYKICTQADAHWAENFMKRQDPRGEDYYWMTGKFENRDNRPDTDIQALSDGYASVVPVTIDFTNQIHKSWIEKNWD